jgi:hypothetical protein
VSVVLSRSAAVRPLFPDAAGLLRWLPSPSTLPSGVSSWGNLYIATNFLLSDLLAKINAASSAARRPAGLQRSSRHPDFSMDVSLPPVLAVVKVLLPALRQVVMTAHDAYGRLLDGVLVSTGGDAVWAAFEDDSGVRSPGCVC